MRPVAIVAALCACTSKDDYGWRLSENGRLSIIGGVLAAAALALLWGLPPLKRAIARRAANRPESVVAEKKAVGGVGLRVAIIGVIVGGLSGYLAGRLAAGSQNDDTAKRALDYAERAIDAVDRLEREMRYR
jgi:hypothetical protein